MKKCVLFSIALLLGLTCFAQEKKFGIKFSGFVKNDMFFDTRQTTAAREGHFLIYPNPEILDDAGDDINAGLNYNFLAVQSRLSGKITGPDAFGAKTSGVIEGDFFAQLNDNINLFRMRHAFVKLNWEATQLLFGQYWNPMFVTGCYPGTVSFNTGCPFQPFARNPQVRLTKYLGDLQVTVAALGQRDYASRGANGASSQYLRNSGIPDMHIQIHYSKSDEEAQTDFLFGVGGAFKQIVPRLQTDVGYKTDETVSGMSFMGFLKYKMPILTFKLEGVYGENLADVLSISGFAVEKIKDIPKNYVSYLPLSTMSFWGDIHTNGENFQFGIFAGYSKNLGAANDVTGPVYGLGVAGLGKNNDEGIEYMYRISPRLVFNSNKLRFALEGEYTGASFGNLDAKAVPSNNTTQVANMRLLFATYYFF